MLRENAAEESQIEIRKKKNFASGALSITDYPRGPLELRHPLPFHLSRIRPRF